MVGLRFAVCISAALMVLSGVANACGETGELYGGHSHDTRYVPHFRSPF